MPANPHEISLSTFGDLLTNGFRLVAFCPSCRDHRELDLARYPAGQSYIKKIFRCGRCGTVGSVSLSKIVIGGDGHSPGLDRWRRR